MIIQKDVKLRCTDINNKTFSSNCTLLFLLELRVISAYCNGVVFKTFNYIMLAAAETEFIRLIKIDPFLFRAFIMLFSKKTMLEYMEKIKYKPYIEFIPRNTPTLLKTPSNNNNFKILSAWIHKSELKNLQEKAGYNFHDASNMHLRNMWVTYNLNYNKNKNSHFILAHELVALFQEKDGYKKSYKITCMKHLSYDNLYHTFKKSKSLSISQIVGNLTNKYEDFFGMCVDFKLYNLAKLYIEVDKHNTITEYDLRLLLRSNTSSSDAIVAFQPQLAKRLKTINSIKNSYTRLNKQVNNSLSTLPPNILKIIKNMAKR